MSLLIDGCNERSDEEKELLSDVDASAKSNSSASHAYIPHCRSTLDVFLMQLKEKVIISDSPYLKNGVNWIALSSTR